MEIKIEEIVISRKVVILEWFTFIKLSYCWCFIDNQKLNDLRQFIEQKFLPNFLKAWIFSLWLFPHLSHSQIMMSSTFSVFNFQSSSLNSFSNVTSLSLFSSTIFWKWGRMWELPWEEWNLYPSPPKTVSSVLHVIPEDRTILEEYFWHSIAM